MPLFLCFFPFMFLLLPISHFLFFIFFFPRFRLFHHTISWFDVLTQSVLFAQAECCYGLLWKLSIFSSSLTIFFSLSLCSFPLSLFFFSLSLSLTRSLFLSFSLSFSPLLFSLSLTLFLSLFLPLALLSFSSLLFAALSSHGRLRSWIPFYMKSHLQRRESFSRFIQLPKEIDSKNLNNKRM